MFASLNAKVRGLSGRAASRWMPSPLREAPALTAREPLGHETESAFVAPAGTAADRKAVRSTATLEVAEATTTRAAAANAAMNHLPMPQSLPVKPNTAAP